MNSLFALSLKADASMSYFMRYLQFARYFGFYLDKPRNM